MRYKIVIANEKGGVAKTTSAVSLAGALVELEKRVLVIDLDPQANLTLALGHKPKQGRLSTANILLNSENVSKTIIKTKNITILKNNNFMCFLYSLLLMMQKTKLKKLRDLFEKAAFSYNK